MEAAIAWGVPLVACILVTAAAIYLGMHPLLAAFCAPPATALFIALVFWRTDAFRGLAAVIITVCALPLTIVTAIVTDNLMDKYGRTGL